MSGYIGSQPADSFLSISSQQITGNGGATYSLNSSVTSPEDLAVFVNNIRQNPNNYSVSNNQITLGGTIASSDSCYVVFLGKTLATVSPPSSSVGLTQLSATGTKNNTTFLRGDNTFATPSGGSNTPFFLANLSSNQSVTSNAITKINFNNEIADPSGVYDHTSNFRFTPASAGYYMVNINLLYTPIGQDLHGAVVKLYFNGAYEALGGGVFENYDINAGSEQSLRINQLVYFDANDYAEVYARFSFHPATSSCNVQSGTGNNESIGSTFSAYKIIE